VVSGRPAYQALGTVANKQGRIAGINISGGYATFPGVAGTAVTRVCHLEIGRTGLSEREATDAGFSFVAATVTTTTNSAYMPDAAPLTVKLVVERGRGTLLGVQIVGGHGAAKRVDVVAAALTAGCTAEDLINMDLGYAPPFSSVWDPLQAVARDAVARLG
jgi:pyruvate/2-oxoglutarate dehydrogenase complex dihydrolipoamide dehydrogenase (E3) component